MPQWLGEDTMVPMVKHNGRRLVVQVHGKQIECCTIGELAAALGRTPQCVRQWERRGLIPQAPLMLPGAQNTKRRLYPLQLADAIRRVAEREGFGRRRPSGLFSHQQRAIWDAWKGVMAPLLADADDPPGVTD